MEFTVNPQVTNMNQFFILNNLPEVKEEYCTMCGCTMPHKVFGVSEESRGLAYACIRCGRVVCGADTYDVARLECSTCSGPRPHVKGYDCGERTWTCAACGRKILDPEILDLLKSQAKFEDDEGINAKAILEYFKKEGYDID